jgi:hypothetical protein
MEAAAIHGRSTDGRRVLPCGRRDRSDEQRRFAELSPPEIILVAMVVLVIALFEVWFFFYSPSPIDRRTRP